jgi:hypothetical protein
MTSYLMVIGDREALGWILTASRMAFPSESRPEVRCLAEGDELLIYTTRSAFKNPGRDRGRIIGTARVASEVVRLENPVVFDDREYPIGCDLKIGPLVPFGHGVELAPLIPQLQAFDGAGSAWSMRLRRPLLALTEHDTILLHRALDGVRRADGTTFDTMAGYTRWFVDRMPRSKEAPRRG